MLCFINYVIYIYSLADTTRPSNQWRPSRGMHALLTATWPFAQWRPSAECHVYLLLYTCSYDKNDTSVLTATHSCKMPCFICYYIYIYILMTKTTRPFVFPVTPICGMQCFICYYTYMFLWKKRHDHSPSDARQWNSMFFLATMYIFLWLKRHCFNRVVLA
jgi:hypothetical protein